MLLHDPSAAEQTTGPAGDGGDPGAQAPVERPCPTCGSPLEEGQEWCLECGTATTSGGRGLPGWRTAAAVIAVTLVMASGAVAAAYAAIRGDDASSPPPTAVAQGPTQSPVPTPPPIDIPPETGTTTTPPPASGDTPPPVEPPPATPPIETPPAATPPASTPPVVTPPPATGSGSGTGTGTGSGSSSGNGSGTGSDQGNETPPVTRAKLVEVPLDPETTVASSYNPVVTAPAGAAGTSTTPTTTETTPTTPTTPAPAAGGPAPAHADSDFTGEPKLAFDGDPATTWSVALPTPELVAEPSAGLLIDLGTATKLRRLTLIPTTPGTTIEVYGTKDAKAPATLDDKGWTKLATQLDVDGKTNITLGDDPAGTGKLRQVLIWFAEGPDDGTSTSVGIRELKLYR